MASNSKRFCTKDLGRERRNCSFDQEELTNILDGGKEGTESRRRHEKRLLNDPAFEDDVPFEYLSHEDGYSNELAKSCHIQELFRNNGLSVKAFNPLELMRNGDPLLLNRTVFYNTLKGQGDEEQRRTWLRSIEKGEIIGSYAQTELGHGSFVRGLETTASYDETTEEFVLHSPTITATKWWPGGLGKTSNSAVVMAQLYTKGRCHGPHLFLAQVRDGRTHKTLPGVTLGEIGPRMGMNANDNGFLRFNHYRIPRRNMLMRYSQVLKDGTYVKPAHDKLSYGSMVVTRVGIVRMGYEYLRKGVTIAVRYSAVRRQSELVPGEPEPQILDYQTQQYKLIPHIASVFAIFFAAQSCEETYREAIVNIEKGDVGQLPELHALSSGLKSLSGMDAVLGVETCRLACGGHGYLSSSGLPGLYGLSAAMMTYEGENTVLWLQVARYLIKTFQRPRQSDAKLQSQGSASYLLEKPKAQWTDDISDIGLVEAYKLTSLSLVAKTEERLRRLIESGIGIHHAWNKCSVALVKCAQTHTRYYVCDQYVKRVESLRASYGTKNVLRQLCRLYLVHHILLNSGDFLKAGTLSSSSLTALEEELTYLLERLRPEAVSIVDAFDIDDKILNSTLGAWDGNVYERLYKEALKSPLNKEDVPKAYYRYLRPLIKNSKL